MRRLLLTASISALLLLAFGHPAQSAVRSDSTPTPPAFMIGNTSAANISTRTPAMNVPRNAAPQNAANVIAANWNDGRPIVVIQHNMPANIDLKARPRIASDLAVALREPSFAIFATAVTFLLGMALFSLRWNLR